MEMPTNQQKPSEYFAQQVQKQQMTVQISQENLIAAVNNLLAYAQGLEKSLEQKEKAVEPQVAVPQKKEGEK